jgi:hypothetical protein
MRNRKSTDLIAVISIAAASLAMLWSACEFAPRFERKLHASIGEVLAKAAVSLLGQGGQITVITRDTESSPQPAIDILLNSFRREVRRLGATVLTTHAVQLDPLRPVEVPPGDFYELIRRAPAGHVIVSFLGPPVLAEEQRVRLGTVKPKIVAFCCGNLAELVDLRQLFTAGLLHAAVVNRRGSPAAAGMRPRVSSSFDQLYTLVQGKDLLRVPAGAGAAR